MSNLNRNVPYSTLSEGGWMGIMGINENEVSGVEVLVRMKSK
jgi:hypothetical protein